MDKLTVERQITILRRAGVRASDAAHELAAAIRAITAAVKGPPR